MNNRTTTFTLIGLLFFFNTCYAQYTTIMDFDNSLKGSYPHGSLISDGTFLYGMTTNGGTNGYGIIFKIKPDGSGFVTLLNFTGTANGRGPWATLLLHDGYLYGTAAGGGINDLGVLFKVKTDGTDYIKLVDFNGTVNGSTPIGSLTFDGTYLYGVTSYGGSVNMGTLYKIKPDGTGFKTLIDFNMTNGKTPNTTVISVGDYLYGMSEYGGANNYGTIFKLKNDGTEFLKLLDFDGTNNGGYPPGMFVADSQYLYAMTLTGGVNNFGTIFKIKTDGTGYLKLLDFDGIQKGSYPNGSLTFDGRHLYGMTAYGGTKDYGALFKIKTDGTGYLKLLDFSYQIGSRPLGEVLNDGTFFYGMTYNGGANNYGALFKYLYPTSGISLVSEEKICTVYPNPNNGHFTLQMDRIVNGVVEILNPLGQYVFHSGISNRSSLEIDLSSFAKGIYFVKVTGENGMQQINKITFN